MPVNGFGICVSSETVTKQENLRGLLWIIMNTAKQVMTNEFLIFDLNAARSCYPGEDGNQITGSAVIGIEMAQKFNLSYRATLCELLAGNADDLRWYFANNRNVTVLQGDNRQTLPGRLLGRDYRSEHFGYVYVDPNDAQLPTNLLVDMFGRKAYTRTDLIINVAAASIKRITSTSGRDEIALRYVLANVGKRKWLVREPHARQQWTFLVGTNWVNFPEWRKQGFVSLESDEGRRIWRLLDLTEKQRKQEAQLSLLE